MKEEASSTLAGLDLAAIEPFFAAHVAGARGPLRARLLSGGRSNITYLIEGEGGPWVLRRPPLGHVLPTAHDMAREHRVLAALAGTGVPAPRPFALCSDAGLIGAPFYVMQYTPGVILEGPLPAGFAATAEERGRLSRAVIAALARLHAVDFAAIGLADFGRPEGYLERQVKRWIQQWERSQTRPLAQIAELSRRLSRALPASPPAAIVHGDYRLGNMAIDPADPGRIVAILDWEMATLGDPLADLGWLLIYWGEPGDPAEVLAVSGGAAAIPAEPGFLSRAELVAEYGRLSGLGDRAAETVDFYQVLALFKLAIISEGIHARYLMGMTVGEGFRGVNPCESLADLALARASRAADPRLRG
jgi:aminoglycoside phosphotransferase (APT) family kinase protein